MAVVLQQRLGLVAVHLHPVADDLFGVVGAATGLEPLEQLLLGDGELQHGVELGVVVLQHLVERLGLLYRARVAVENKPGSRVLILDPVLDQLVRQLRWHQIARVEVALGLDAQRGALADVLAEQVPGRDLRDAELLGQLLRLRAFARTGRSE